MLFEIESLKPDDPRQICKDFNPGRQMILCLFRRTESAIYHFEELVEHRARYMVEMRKSDPSRAWQQACDEYEHRSSPAANNVLVIMRLLAQDLSETYPNIGETGFDLGITFMPKDGNKFLLPGGALFYDIFPRKKAGGRTQNNWPYFDPAPCRITIPIGMDDPQGFFGIIGVGLADSTRRLGIRFTANAGETEVWKRRREGLTEVLKVMPPAPFFILDDQKHCFLNHAFNNLSAWVNKKLGGPDQTVALGDETETTFNKDDESITHRPRPYLQR